MWKKFPIVIHSAVPLCLGVVIYFFLAPDVFFVRKLTDAFPALQGHEVMFATNGFSMFIRNYFLDMLWGYSLVPALYLLLGKATGALKKSFIIAVIFAVVMESLQLTTLVPGTFDYWDIGAEVLSEVVAAAVLLQITIREERE